MICLDFRRYMKKIVVPELWELICEEKEVFSFKDLSQLSFGKNITDDHISALVRALFSDGIYFKMKDGNFIPNSIEKVEQIKKSQELAELRAREINEMMLKLR